MNDIPEHGFDWKEAQLVTGCSDQQTLFGQAVCQGMSLTQAARAAGYAGTGSALRGAASRIHKSRKVQSLLALARSGDAGVTEDVISREACKRELSRMIRHGDATQKIRCIEGLEKMRAEERELAAASDLPRPIDTVKMLLDQCGEVGALAAVGLHFSNDGTTNGMPFGRALFQVTKAAFPEAWQRMLQNLKPEFRRCVPELEAMAEGPAPTIRQILSNADTAMRDAKPNGPIEAKDVPTQSVAD